MESIEAQDSADLVERAVSLEENESNEQSSVSVSKEEGAKMKSKLKKAAKNMGILKARLVSKSEKFEHLKSEYAGQRISSTKEIKMLTRKLKDIIAVQLKSQEED